MNRGQLDVHGERAMRKAWLGYWGAMRRYHRYEVHGIEHLQRPGPFLIVGYHGRPIAHDLAMLQSLWYEEHGEILHAVMHETARELPLLRWLVTGMEFVTGDDEELARRVDRGGRIIVTPGGIREGTNRERYRVEWGRRRGYLRLALKYQLPIIPTAGKGVDETFVSLNDGYEWGKRLRVPGKLPAWAGLGPLGLWPISPPFPIKIATYIGEPIDVVSSGVEANDEAGLDVLAERVVGVIQGLLDEANR